jgi:ADP-ribosylglycohydrolase
MANNKTAMAGGADLRSERMARARLALDGLSIGDALGQVFLRQPGNPLMLLRARRVPDAPWRYSDDTEMALAIVEVLGQRGTIDQDLLAAAFARRFGAAPERGYGAAAYHILSRILGGQPWREAATSVYGGQGSMGNGAAMRVAPLGAWFADDTDAVVQEADASAAVTHAHPEGRAGAVAVALAAAYAGRCAWGEASSAPADLLRFVAERMPPGDTRQGVVEAEQLLGQPAGRVSQVLGDGSQVISRDTVPYALWCAASSLADFEAAIWLALDGLLSPSADRDTVCAIVGGIVASSASRSALPAAWLSAREPLPDE